MTVFDGGSLGVASCLQEVESGSLAQPLPALGLPPEALCSLRHAFTREVNVRLPRLLDLVRNADAVGPLALAGTDAAMLAEGCALLGDAAAARALRRLVELLTSNGECGVRIDAAETAALLLGRWAAGSGRCADQT
jgi:hypothetical protein